MVSVAIKYKVARDFLQTIIFPDVAGKYWFEKKMCAKGTLG